MAKLFIAKGPKCSKRGNSSAVPKPKGNVIENLKKIRVKFVGGPNATNYLMDIFLRGQLSKEFDFEVVSSKPNYLIYLNFGFEHREYTDFDCIKIFFTAENLVPNFNECDYAMSFDHLEFGDRYARVPYFAQNDNLPSIEARTEIQPQEIAKKTKFCNFIFSNTLHAEPIRDEFFHLLSEYKKVDSAGTHLNNHPNVDDIGASSNRIANKISFQSDYKFSIAFENSQHNGYTTEKIVDAFAARTIPIYWGNPLVKQDISPASFISAYDFDGLPALVDEVIRIDKDKAAFEQMLNAPVILGDRSAAHYRLKQEAFLRSIFSQPIETARRRPRAGNARAQEMISVPKNRKGLHKLARMIVPRQY